MDKYTDEKLNDMFYALEKRLTKAEKTLANLMQKLNEASYRLVEKSSRVTINKRTAKEGDVVAVFKVESENPFE